MGLAWTGTFTDQLGCFGGSMYGMGYIGYITWSAWVVEPAVERQFKRLQPQLQDAMRDVRRFPLNWVTLETLVVKSHASS